MTEFKGITTRRGDDGTSEILGGVRFRKSESVFAALGEVDELSSSIGLAKALMRRDHPETQGAAQALETVQSDLARLGALIATPERKSPRRGPEERTLKEDGAAITAGDVLRLEDYERTYVSEIDVTGTFTIPGGSVAGAQLDVSRAVCRRAERQLVSHISQSNAPHLGNCLKYLNRLSDLLYIIARRIEMLYILTCSADNGATEGK